LRFAPARTYLTAAAIALGLAVFSGWCAYRWLPAAVPGVLFVMSAGAVLWLGLQPAITVTERELRTSKRVIAWKDVRRVDQTGWISPMVVDLTLADRTKVRLVYPGETEKSAELLRIIQQRSTGSLINGVPYKQIFGEPSQAAEATRMSSPKYRLLTEEDEAEVERLYQKLRAAGRLDPEK
jgi:hypothetical protein